MDDFWRTDSDEEEFEGFRVSAEERDNYRRRTRKRRAAVAFGEDTDDESREGDGEESDDEEMESEGEDTEDDDEQLSDAEEGDDAHTSDSSISSLGLSSGESKDQCPICLMTLKGQKLGKPNCCQHIFCLDCIQEWAKNVNTCPVDRKTFNQISVYNSKKGPVVSKITVEDRQVEEEFEEDPTFCQVCNQCDREDVLLLCDGCDRGYHLDCMTPPLYHVPIDEWFCHECRQDNTTDHANEPITNDRQTRAETRSRGTRSRPRGRRAGLARGGATAGPSSSNSSGESSTTRARTVASVRRRGTTRGRARGRGRGRRGRGRGRTRSSSRTRGGTRKRKRRTKRKTKTGTSTSTGKKVTKRRKYKRTRTTRKRRKVSRGGPLDEIEPRQAGLKGTVRGRLRDSIQTNASSSSWELGRTLGKCAFPSRLEPTLSFALFGNDLSLETPTELPENEAGSGVKQESESLRPQANNPDVLGSIFEGLETLHSHSTRITREGDVVRRELGRKKSDETGKTGQTSPTSNVKLETENGFVEFKPPRMTHMDKNDNGREATKSSFEARKANKEGKNESTMGKENTAVQSLVRKSIPAGSERFRDKETKSKERELASPSAVKEENRTTESLSHLSKFRLNKKYKETPHDISSFSSTSSIKFTKYNLKNVSTLCPPRKQTRFSDATLPVSLPQLSSMLSSYKIPRKPSLDNSPVKQEQPTASGCVTAGTGSSNWPESSQLAEDSRRDWGQAGTSSSPHAISPASIGRNSDWSKDGPSVISCSSRDKNDFGPVLKKGSDGSGTNVPEGPNSPQERYSVKQEHFPSSSPMKAALKLTDNICSPVVKSSVVTKRSVHFASNSEPPRHVLDKGSHKTNEYRSTAGAHVVSETDVRKKQNLDIINTLRNKTLDMRARLLREIRTGESSIVNTDKTSVVTSVTRKAEDGCIDNLGNGNITGACAKRGDAVQTHARASPLSVTPTHQVCDAMRQSATHPGGDQEKNIKEPQKVEENEREKRRLQGIARLQRIAQITDEVKLALKPFYRHGEVNKSEYKDIYRRAVDKIKSSSSSIDRDRVTSLVKKYVKHLKGQRAGDT